MGLPRWLRWRTDRELEEEVRPTLTSKFRATSNVGFRWKKRALPPSAVWEIALCCTSVPAKPIRSDGCSRWSRISAMRPKLAAKPGLHRSRYSVARARYRC